MRFGSPLGTVGMISGSFMFCAFSMAAFLISITRPWNKRSGRLNFGWHLRVYVRLPQIERSSRHARDD
jgi:hypothetical protein